MEPFVHDLWFETHSWAETKAFWMALGWTVVHEFGAAGSLHAPGGGPYFFFEEVEVAAPLRQGVYVEVPPGFEPPATLAVGPWEDSGYGPMIAAVTDPDGRLLWLQTPTPPEA